MVRGGRMRLRKVAGERNPADLLTKPKTGREMEEMIRLVGGRILWGRGDVQTDG